MIAPHGFLETIFVSSFLTQSISTFVASLKFDLNFSCGWLSLISKSFSLFHFCLALFLAKIIVDGLISILIISQNKPLSLRNAIFRDELWYLFCYHLHVRHNFSILDCGLHAFLNKEVV